VRFRYLSVREVMVTAAAAAVVVVLVVVVLILLQFNLQSQVDSARFVSYMCEQVLPQFDEISSNEEGADPQLEILKLFAELCTHCGILENAESKIEKVFERLIVSQVVFFSKARSSCL
jgi:hypothetical protein